MSSTANHHPNHAGTGAGAEVEIALDRASTRNTDSLQSIPNSFSSPDKKATPNVYMCGLLPKRYHNQAIYAIAHDLMPEFFVSTNPLQANRWNDETTRIMLGQSEALLFLLNEATVSDRRCLLTLQYAWELSVPIVMLRHPRVRLIIKPASAAVKSSSNHHDHDPNTPNTRLLQDIIYEAYKESLEYDRNNHLAGMRRIVNRLLQQCCKNSQGAKLLHPLIPTIRYPEFGVGHTGDVVMNNHLRLPHIPSPPHSLVIRPSNGGKNTISPATTTTNILRSRSLGNLSKLDGGGAGNGRMSLKLSGDTEDQWAKSNNNNNSHHRRHHHSTSVSRRSSHNGKTDLQLQPGEITQRLLSPFGSGSTDDPSLYHETQYLIFPVKDKNQKPRLIRFPSALTDPPSTDGHQQDADSIWGSDTSLEEEAERAERVKGGLDVRTPPETPAPYIAPL